MLAELATEPRQCQRCGQPLAYLDRRSLRRIFCADCREWIDGEGARRRAIERGELWPACAAARLIRRQRYEDAALAIANILRWHQLFASFVDIARSIRQERYETAAVVVAQLIRIAEHLGRPRRRADCLQGGFNCERPCPYVTCREHLFCNVDPENGAIKFAWPDKEPGELEYTCALDIADEGAHVLEEIASRVGMVRERVRQLEIKGLARMRILMPRRWRLLPRPHGKFPSWHFRSEDPEVFRDL